MDDDIDTYGWCFVVSFVHQSLIDIIELENRVSTIQMHIAYMDVADQIACKCVRCFACFALQHHRLCENIGCLVCLSIYRK